MPVQRMFNQSEHSSWETRSTRLTYYVLNKAINQNISLKKSKTLDLLAMLKYKKLVQLIKTFLLKNQRHWTHCLYWNIAVQSFWTNQNILFVKQENWTNILCDSQLINQSIIFQKSMTLDSPPILEHENIDWLI
jgi:hypothetical protein